MEQELLAEEDFSLERFKYSLLLTLMLWLVLFAAWLSADDAVRVARLGREILLGLENPGADWVKLEVLGDSKTLLPDPVATLQATEQLVAEGFQVLCYTSDDPILCKRLEEVGCATVMPLGSWIGSNQGLRTKAALEIIIEQGYEIDRPSSIFVHVESDDDIIQNVKVGGQCVMVITGTLEF